MDSFHTTTLRKDNHSPIHYQKSNKIIMKISFTLDSRRDELANDDPILILND